MSGIVLKASVNVRMRKGARFPKGSLRAALEPARASLVRDVNRAFDTMANPVNGSKWPERKYHYAWPMLVKSGAMKAAAVRAAATATINGNTLFAKMASPKYSAYQQKGTRAIRARRFLGASIGTVRVVQAGLVREGRMACLRVCRGS